MSNIIISCKTIWLFDLGVGLGDADDVVEAADTVVNGRLFRVMHPHSVDVELVLKARKDVIGLFMNDDTYSIVEDRGEKG